MFKIVTCNWVSLACLTLLGLSGCAARPDGVAGDRWPTSSTERTGARRSWLAPVEVDRRSCQSNP